MSPSRSFDLSRAARQFAEELTGTLNATVTDGVRLTAVTARQADAAFVGFGISKNQLQPRESFPLMAISGRPQVFMNVSYRLRADDERDYLMVQNSVVALAMDVEMDRELLHVDYERDKADDYPEAHLQVAASSEAWEELSPGRALSKLHLPVGPRRFRPSLEDVIEFVAREGLVGCRDGWRDVVQHGRQGFLRRQLRAAIRRNPDIAREILNEIEGR